MGLLSGGLSMAQELLAIRYISPPWAQTATLHKGQRDKGGGGWVRNGERGIHGLRHCVAGTSRQALHRPACPARERHRCGPAAT